MNCDVWTSSGSLRQQDSELPASLAEAEAETLRLVAYLREHGHRVRSGRDVYEAIRSLPDEEELGAEQRSDGVVVTHASDGWEMLIPLGELMPLSLDVAMASHRAPRTIEWTAGHIAFGQPRRPTGSRGRSSRTRIAQAGS